MQDKPNDDIDITGLKVWDVLAALYNSTEALGMGKMQPGSSQDMTPAEAYKLLNLDVLEEQPEGRHGAKIDYFRGRPIKVTFKQDGPRTMLQGTRLFDRDSFRPAADVIDELRQAQDS